MSRLMRAALDLTAAGWFVLPLDGKTPTTGLTPHGHKDATTSPRQIRKWWAEADWNIGAVVPDSLMVFDVDPRNGGSLRELAHLAGVTLPPTLEVISGRGDGGRHLYFKRPFAQPYRGGIPRGIDVKVSGYCVMPPSLHPESGKPYRWVSREVARLPQPVIELMRPRTPTSDGVPTAASVARLVSFVRDLKRGEKHDGLFWAASRAHEAGISQRGLEKIIDAASDIGMDPREARRVVESAGKEQDA